MLDVDKIRADFPILQEEAHPGVPLVYLDSAASSQKPLQVIEAMNDYYRRYNANMHRGIPASAVSAEDRAAGAGPAAPVGDRKAAASKAGGGGKKK
jgi:cysteine desulfurase/selenocysteine lyase